MHVCQTYERAVANKPPVMQKRFWRRYIYLWRLHGKRVLRLSPSQDLLRPLRGAF